METTTQKRGMTSADLYALKSVTDPQISPDGTKVIYVQTSINNETDKYDSHLYIYDFEQKKHSQWTYGEGRNHSPRWSPDGKSIAFLSNRDKETQAYLISTNGGEPRQLTKCKSGISSIEWCPFSKRILFSVSLKPGELIVNKQVSNEKDDELEPIVVEGLRYKLNGVGFFKDKRKQLAFIDINTGVVEQLTSDKSDYLNAIWSPDGSSIAFSAGMGDDRDEKLSSDVFIMSLSDRQSKKLTNSNGMFGSISWSPDGQYLAFKGHEKEFDSATQSKIWLYHLKDNFLQCLTNGLDVHFQDVAVTDSVFNSPNPEILWTEDS
ncbi:DPP IV N-terminal domain-containing protein [Metabacillus herbersteinensis]|uniref:DPP IV N-terminal domain-containing protein n=1 Tax=Metabacillus herbersteinensis TaxID=283816 RepID=UPI00406BAA1B